jgi:hypothetical protein
MTCFKRLLALVTLSLLVAAAPARAQLERSKNFSEEMQFNAIESVVRITLSYDKLRVRGCGVCIRSDGKHTWILTCAHVIEKADQAVGTKIEFFCKKSYPTPCWTHTAGFESWIDRANDLALLKVAVKGARIARLCPANTRLRFNTPVLAVGCGVGAPPVAQIGTFVGQDKEKDFLMDRGAIGGRSGGALINNEGLIGIIARTSEDRTHAVNYWKIHQFLTRVGQAPPVANLTVRR